MAVLRQGTPLKHGTFVIVSLLGRGGFGEVYLARQPRMDREVAVKVLAASVGEDPEVLRRFEREALAAGSLLHPNVLPVFDFDFDEEAGIWFLAMQYVPGGRTLKDLLGGPVDLGEAARILALIAGALDEAHAKGIVHRDVKPANVLLDDDRPILTDFGIAHLGSLTGLTATGTAIGTPAYLSPEQGLGRLVGPRSDQYSLAVMAFEMVAGRLPFTGDSVSLVVQHANTPPPAVTSFNPMVPEAAASVIARGMSKNPDDRYASCSDFARALLAACPQPAAASSAAGRGGLTETVKAQTGGPGTAEAAGDGEPGGAADAYAPAALSSVTGQLGAQPGKQWGQPGGVQAEERGPPVPTFRGRRTRVMGIGAMVLVALAGSFGAVRWAQSQAPEAGTSDSGAFSGRPGASVEEATGARSESPGVPEVPPAGIAVGSTPPASILVNGEPAGRTPRQLQLPPGSYDVTLVAPTYREWTTRVSLAEGQQLSIPPVDLVPKPAAQVLEITATRLGRDPFVDAGGLIRLGTATDTFLLSDDVNAIIYLRPQTFGIRDLSFTVTTRWAQAGGVLPREQSAAQQVPRDWDQTFIRACAPALALDARGSNTPLTLEILIDGELAETFTFWVAGGSPASAGPSQCDASAVPRTLT